MIGIPIKWTRVSLVGKGLKRNLNSFFRSIGDGK